MLANYPLTGRTPVVNIKAARERKASMQEALTETPPTLKEMSPVNKEDPVEKATYWVNKGFLAILAIGAGLLISFGGWLIVNVNQITTNTSVLSSEFLAYKGDMAELKVSVDQLRIRGEGWATKDALLLTKDGLRAEISLLKDQLNAVEVRLIRMESRSSEYAPAPTSIRR